MTKTIRIFQAREDAFYKKFNTLNKKLKKYNSEVLVTNKNYGFQQFESVTKEGGLVSVMRKVVEITVEVPEVLGKQGVTFLGNLSIKSGVPQIYSVSDDTKVFENFDRSGKCDHCNHSRHRLTWSFFEENGVVKQIGSTCVLEYYGFPVNEILDAMDVTFTPFINEIDDYSKSFCDDDDDALASKMMSSSADFVSLKKFLPHLSKVTKGFERFWEKSDLTGTTQFAISSYFSGTAPDMSDSEIQNLIDKIKNFWPVDYRIKSDFEYNIISNLWDYDGDFIDYYPVSNLGIVSWAIWKALFCGNSSNDLNSSTNVYIGNIGDKIEVSGNISISGGFDSQYGYTRIYKIETGSGNIKWFSSKDIEDDLEAMDSDAKHDWRYYVNILKTEGVNVSLKATVKGHNEYNGRKETIVTRVKILTIEE